MWVTGRENWHVKHAPIITNIFLFQAPAQPGLMQQAGPLNNNWKQEKWPIRNLNLNNVVPFNKCTLVSQQNNAENKVDFKKGIKVGQLN